MSEASSNGRVPAALFSPPVSVLSLRQSLLLVWERARHVNFHHDTLHSLRTAVRRVVYCATCALVGFTNIQRSQTCPGQLKP